MEMNLSIEKEPVRYNKKHKLVYAYTLVITKGVGIREHVILKGGKAEALRLIEFGVKKDF